MADFDTVVIGSGAGGMAAAVALAQSGQKVLVLEQHYLPGGWCHTFTLGGYRFSPGVHYLGELQPGGRNRAIYEGLGVSRDLVFSELNPDGYDHVSIAGERFDFCKGKQALGDRLGRRFPRDAKGVRAYLDTCENMSRELDELSNVRGVLDVLRLPWRAPNVLRWGLRSARALIDGHVRDPLLRAVLGGQSGDHGLPPKSCPAPVHASVMAHYFDGGFYPQGGGFAIPRAFLRALRRAGGELRLRTRVERILVEDGRAVGVRLADGQEISAKYVVSNADPGITFGKLMDPEHVPSSLRRKLRRSRWSVSAVSLFMAADIDARALGLDSGNYWHYAHSDLDEIYGLGFTPRSVELDEVPGFFLTVTTLKDPTKSAHGHHTMEAFAFVDYDAFRAWEASSLGERPDGYNALKARLQSAMIRAASKIIPGLEKRLVFAELGTPLTNAHYLAATRGNLYGTNKTLGQVGPWAWQVRTPIEALRLCGASTLSHGVMGATLSGLAAASSILRCRGHELLNQQGPSLRIFPADRPEAWPEAVRRHAPMEESVVA